jgi:UDP-N-acetylmuramoyl-L-alanyl-D-glutamate--2,6-diaminopimelate ligase
MNIKSKLKKLIRPFRQSLKSHIASVLYGNPAGKMTVIGITGTKGKTSTSIMLGKLLQSTGRIVGYITTAEICDGIETRANPYHMTTIDPMLMQKYLYKMEVNGCTHVVLEMSSEGLAQGRHKGVGGFDVAVFLNLYPEHIESHGSLLNYAKSKALLFKALRTGGTALLSTDTPEWEIMQSLIPLHKGIAIIPFSIKDTTVITNTSRGIVIRSDGRDYQTNFQIIFEAHNAMVAARVAEYVISGVVGEPRVSLMEQFMKPISVPGRMDWAVKSENIDIVVDYAHEPVGMKLLLETMRSWVDTGRYSSLLHIISSDGAGRDDWKKPEMGKLSFDYATHTFVTTDNYSEGDDPVQIINLLMGSASPLDKLHISQFLERRDAMGAAITMARSIDGKVLIVSTGVGNENGLTRPGGRIQWNEKEEWIKLFSEQ